MSVIGFLVVAASEVDIEASGVVVTATEVGLLLVTDSEVVAGVIVVHIGKLVVLLVLLICSSIQCLQEH